MDHSITVSISIKRHPQENWCTETWCLWPSCFGPLGSRSASDFALELRMLLWDRMIDYKVWSSAKFWEQHLENLTEREANEIKTKCVNWWAQLNGISRCSAGTKRKWLRWFASLLFSYFSFVLRKSPSHYLLRQEISWFLHSPRVSVNGLLLTTSVLYSPPWLWRSLKNISFWVFRQLRDARTS